jgi:capsule polysaccharide export protein KpsE/RkpR
LYHQSFFKERIGQIVTPEPKRENLVLVHPDEITVIDPIEVRQRRAETVARLRLLWRERRFLWKAALYGLIVSLAIAFLIPTRYQSTVRLMPPDQSGTAGMLSALTGITGGGASGDPGAGLGSLAGIAGDVLGLKTSSDLFVGILESRTIQDDLINKFNLRKVYWDRRMEDARHDLIRKTDISADRKSGIITIAVTDHNPQRAAAMAREYVSQLDVMLVSLNTSAAHREKVFLEDRLNQVNHDLEAAEKKLGEFSSRHATLDVKEQGIAMVASAATLEGQLVATQTELQGFKQIYSDSNVRVRSIQARVDELKRQIQKVGGTAGAVPEAGGEAPDSIYPSIRQLPLLGVEFADLYRETKVQEATFAMLTREYEMAKVEEAKELPSVKILDEPDVPGKRSFPPRLLITCFGTGLAFILGIAFIWGSENWKTIDPQDPGKMLATDVWSQVKEHALRVRENGSGGEHVASRFRAGRDRTIGES